jgi:hypothetical protein
MLLGLGLLIFVRIVDPVNRSYEPFVEPMSWRMFLDCRKVAVGMKQGSYY